MRTSEIASGFQSPPDDSRVMMRWWWFGPAVAPDELEAELERMRAAGIGGVEVAFVYPIALDDPTGGFRNVPFLSRAMLEALGFVSRRTQALGMRLDVTIGSGWSYGGRYITPDLAAKCLRFEHHEIIPDINSISRPVPFDGEELLGVYIGMGSKQEMPREYQMLDTRAERIALPEGLGPRVLVFVYASQTGQVVKRAALDADGYVLDHYKRAAIELHLQEAGEKLLGACAPGSVTAIFTDSLEVYGANWTDRLPDEFARRRGYDLRPLLPLIAFDGLNSAELRRDFGQTLTELYEENFLTPMREWAERKGVKFRVQNYGQPPASVASHRQAHLIEGEGWGWRGLTQSRWASSAGHLFEKPVISSETWTWVRSPSYRATPLDLQGEAHEHFLIGINQFIGHGWPYSAPEAGMPGWLFYASGALTEKNPWWPVAPDLFRYLQRLSFLLRQGRPVIEVALYAPSEDAWSSFRTTGEKYLDLWHHVRAWIGPNMVPAILDAGHCFDLIDDGTLAEAARNGYRAVVLPHVRWMPEATRTWLENFSRNGGVVLAVGRKPEGAWDGLELVAEDALSARLAALLPPDIGKEDAPEIGFVHRTLEDGEIYFLANTGNTKLRRTIRFRDHQARAELWNPHSGAITPLTLDDGSATLDFVPYGAQLVVFRTASGGQDSHPSRAGAQTVLPLKDGWAFAIGNDAAKPVALPHRWDEHPATRHFSGTARYSHILRLGEAALTGRLFLDFGEATPAEREVRPDGTLRGNSFAVLVAPPLREAASIFVNGDRIGTLWAPPYQIELTGYLRVGENEVRVDVHNTLINLLAEGGHLPDIEAVRQRYGQRARLQDMDHISPLPSGLLCVPDLVILPAA
jgi:alpha-L-rhamnosidase